MDGSGNQQSTGDEGQPELGQASAMSGQPSDSDHTTSAGIDQPTTAMAPLEHPTTAMTPLEHPTGVLDPLDHPTGVLDPVDSQVDDAPATAVQPVIPAPPQAGQPGRGVPVAATSAPLASAPGAPIQASAALDPPSYQSAVGITAGPAPGWYPDPWASDANNSAGGLRHWDGAAWTGYTSRAHTPPPRLGIPGWALALWWVVVAAVGVGVFFLVVVMAAFACDSGWDGCSQAAADGISAYVIVAVLVATVPPLLAVAIGRGRRLGRVLRILAMVVMPLGLLAGVLASIGLISSRFPA